MVFPINYTVAIPTTPKQLDIMIGHPGNRTQKMSIDIEFFDDEQLQQIAKEWGGALCVAAKLQRTMREGVPTEG